VDLPFPVLTAKFWVLFNFLARLVLFTLFAIFTALDHVIGS